MYPPSERRWPGLVAAYLVLLLLLAVPAVPIYSFVEPTYKLLVIRACTGIVLLFTLHRLVRVARKQLERQPASALEAAALRQGGTIDLAPAFTKLRDEVTNSMRDRSYFGHVLRPRLLALFDRRLRARHGIGVAVLIQQSGNGMDPALLALLTHTPAPRRLSWRGIPLRELQALVQVLEEIS